MLSTLSIEIDQIPRVYHTKSCPNEIRWRALDGKSVWMVDQCGRCGELPADDLDIYVPLRQDGARFPNDNCDILFLYRTNRVQLIADIICRRNR
jgi:hypothetical protein